MTHTVESDLATHLSSETDRMPRGALTMVWWSLCSAMFYLFLGATLALNFGTRNAIIGTLLGVVGMSVLGFIFSRYAIRSGKSCYLLSQELFGTIGSALASLIFFVTAMYYAVFESSVVAIAASKVIGVSYGVACVVIVLYSVPLVAGSVQHWLDKINGLLLPIYVCGLVLAIYMATQKYGYSGAWLSLGPPEGASPTGWWNCFLAYFGQHLLMMCTLDIGRFGRVKDTHYHGVVGFGLAFYVMAFLVNALVGIYLVGSAGLTDVSETVVMDVCLTVMGGTLGLLFVWVTQTRINTANYFLSATNMQAFLVQTSRIKLPKLLCAAIVGAVVLIVMMSTNVFVYLLVALSYQGIILTAWTGVALAYILMDRTGLDGRIVQPEVPTFSKRGLAAWTIGTFAGLLLMATQGLAATLSIPVTLTLAFSVYRFYPGQGAT